MMQTWQVSEAMWTSRVNNLHAFVTAQRLHNILQRQIVQEPVPCRKAHGIGNIPLGPLAGGFLTGKYRRDQPPTAGTLLATKPMADDRVITGGNWAKLAKLDACFVQPGHTIGELTTAWLLAHPWLCAVIAGASRPDQLDEHIAAAAWRLNPAEMIELDKISMEQISADERFALR